MISTLLDIIVGIYATDEPIIIDIIGEKQSNSYSNVILCA